AAPRRDRWGRPGQHRRASRRRPHQPRLTPVTAASRTATPDAAGSPDARRGGPHVALRRRRARRPRQRTHRTRRAGPAALWVLAGCSTAIELSDSEWTVWTVSRDRVGRTTLQVDAFRV